MAIWIKRREMGKAQAARDRAKGICTQWLVSCTLAESEAARATGWCIDVLSKDLTPTKVRLDRRIWTNGIHNLYLVVLLEPVPGADFFKQKIAKKRAKAKEANQELQKEISG